MRAVPERCQATRCGRIGRLSRVALVLWLCGLGRLVLGQATVEEAVHVRQPVALLTDRRVDARLRTADDYARAGQWQQAIDIFQDVCDAHPRVLVALSDSHYCNVQEACQRRIAQWPVEGLRVYRDAADPRARQWLGEAAESQSDEPLQRILRTAYCSSFGDDALAQLAVRAWERGDVGRARGLWEQLLPPDPAASSPARLHYPDPELPPAGIRARLMLCSLALGRPERARREFAAFQTQHADANGQIAGQSGPLVPILAGVLESAESWGPQPQRGQNHPTQTPVDVGAIGWSVPLPRSEFADALETHQSGNEPILAYAPLCYEDRLFVGGVDRILGFEFRSGRPAWWPASAEDSVDDRVRLERATLYPALRVTDPAPPPQNPPLGRHRFRLAVTEGRLLARLGSPITAPGRRELQAHESQLVCLDVTHAEGKVVWTLAARELDPLATFEGTPVAVDDRAFAVLRRSEPQTQLEAVCVSVESGRILWRSPLCGAVSPLGREVNLMTDLRFGVGADRLFLSTDLGAVLCVDAADGLVRWALTYASRWADPAVRRRSELSDPGPACVAHDNVVYAAPADFDGVLALDATDGHLLWQTRLPDGIQHLLGVTRDRLVVSGSGLWGLDLAQGTVVWGSRNRDPEHSGVGQGLIYGDDVWWPHHDRIEVRDVLTGKLTRQPIALTFRGGRGGNLLIYRGHLVIAEPERIVVYSRFGGRRPQPARPTLSLHSPVHSAP